MAWGGELAVELLERYYASQARKCLGYRNRIKELLEKYGFKVIFDNTEADKSKLSVEQVERLMKIMRIVASFILEARLDEHRIKKAIKELIDWHYRRLNPLDKDKLEIETKIEYVCETSLNICGNVTRINISMKDWDLNSWFKCCILVIGSRIIVGLDYDPIY